ncbi:VapE domain-containing protein, partial [Bacillus cereus group sp. Bce007]|uniref:VapE domain-containing protein n=1 Tax=Bacillus cereus group sp. Bce007 TaxID=3445254 RepID=UPI003F21CFE8
LEKCYNLKLGERRVIQAVLNLANSRRIDEIQDYLNGLEWDGVPRMETCLPGVVPTNYTRLVARKCIVGAVARALDPGCQMDLS